MRSRALAWLKTPGALYEEDIPTEQPPSSHEARLPPAHAYPFRPRRHQPSPRQGPQVPLRLIPTAQGIVERLRSHREFVAVLKCRRRVSDSDIVAHYRVRDDVSDNATATESRRLGLAVSKAVGNAVVRNTVKRRFRVLAERYQDTLPTSCDVVLRAKPSAAHASFASLDEQTRKLFHAVARKAGRP